MKEETKKQVKNTAARAAEVIGAATIGSGATLAAEKLYNPQDSGTQTGQESQTTHQEQQTEEEVFNPEDIMIEDAEGEEIPVVTPQPQPQPIVEPQPIVDINPDEIIIPEPEKDLFVDIDDPYPLSEDELIDVEPLAGLPNPDVDIDTTGDIDPLADILA